MITRSPPPHSLDPASRPVVRESHPFMERLRHQAGATRRLVDGCRRRCGVDAYSVALEAAPRPAHMEIGGHQQDPVDLALAQQGHHHGRVFRRAAGAIFEDQAVLRDSEISGQDGHRSRHRRPAGPSGATTQDQQIREAGLEEADAVSDPRTGGRAGNARGADSRAEHDDRWGWDQVRILPQRRAEPTPQGIEAGKEGPASDSLDDFFSPAPGPDFPRTVTGSRASGRGCGLLRVGWLVLGLGVGIHEDSPSPPRQQSPVGSSTMPRRPVGSGQPPVVNLRN